MIDCPECHPTARDAAVLSCARRCRGCGALWIPGAPTARPLDPVRDCEELARYLPQITGSAQAIALAPGDGNKGGSTPGALRGRPDHVDEHHKGLARACATLARLDRMERDGHGRAVRVLWKAYVYTGDATRRHHKGGLPDLIAQAFLTPKQVKAIQAKHKSTIVALAELAEIGSALLAEAHDRYRGVPAPVVVTVVAVHDAVPVSDVLDALIAQAMGRYLPPVESSL